MTKLIVQGSEIVAVWPWVEMTEAFQTPYAVIPKAALSGWQIVDVELPDGFDAGKYTFADGGVVAKPAPPMTDEQVAEMIKFYDGVVQKRLDDVARSFGYGDPNRPEVSPILHAISYAEEPAVPRFQNEGRALRAWRSLVWVTAAGILNAVKAGERAVPTADEVLAELPEAPVQEPL